MKQLLSRRRDRVSFTLGKALSLRVLENTMLLKRLIPIHLMRIHQLAIEALVRKAANVEYPGGLDKNHHL
jgi:hypothetical protein